MGDATTITGESENTASAPGRVVFYTKCRPDVDAWPIARDYRRAFVGYPPWRDPEAAKSSATSGFRRLLADVSTPHWQTDFSPDQTRGYRTQVAANATLARTVEKGSYVLVPRPGDGVCHIGLVKGRFELVDEPEWAQEYLQLRSRNGPKNEPRAAAIGDVVQTWPVERWETVPFPIVPRWISYRLLSRNTAGLIYDSPSATETAHVRIGRLFNGDLSYPTGPATSEHEVLCRLIDWVSPSIFEHLVVDLLQLEEASYARWHHVGGPGDGGVDGIALANDGTRKGVLQCKLWYDDSIQLLADSMAKRHPGVGVVVAVLHRSTPFPDEPIPGVTVLGPDRITELVLRHKDRLPLAVTLGICQQGHSEHPADQAVRAVDSEREGDAT